MSKKLSSRSMGALLLMAAGAVAGTGCVAELESEEAASAEQAQAVGILAAPATPSPFVVISEHCRGLNSVEWGAVAGATTYELWYSVYSDFHSPWLHSSASTVSRFINVGMSTWYLRVRACNADGCSAYSVQRTATYQSGCS